MAARVGRLNRFTSTRTKAVQLMCFSSIRTLALSREVCLMGEEPSRERLMLGLVGQHYFSIRQFSELTFLSQPAALQRAGAVASYIVATPGSLGATRTVR